MKAISLYLIAFVAIACVEPVDPAPVREFTFFVYQQGEPADFSASIRWRVNDKDHDVEHIRDRRGFASSVKLSPGDALEVLVDAPGLRVIVSANKCKGQAEFTLVAGQPFRWTPPRDAFKPCEP